MNLHGWQVVRTVGIGLFLALGLSGSAITGFDGSMRFRTFWPCTGNADYCAPQILAEGRIESSSADALATFLTNKAAHDDKLPPQPTISFDSPGGSLLGGIRLGQLIRDRRLDTNIEAEYSKVNLKSKEGFDTFIQAATCASSCVFAFAGGLRRTVGTGGRVGVHQFYGGERALGDSTTQLAIVTIASYLAKMGVNRELLDAASLVPATSILWLTSQQLHNTRLDNSRPMVLPWEIKAAQNGTPALLTAQEITNGRWVKILLGNDNGQIMVVVQGQYDPKVIRSERLRQFPIGEKCNISFRADGREIIVRSPSLWTNTGSSLPTFQCIGFLSLQEASRLSVAKTLRIDDDFGHALDDVSVSTSLGTANLESGIAMLLRLR